MINLAANLSFLYQDVPFLDRFELAARDGFRGVEYLFPYDHAPQTVKAKLDAFGLTQVLFNLPPGDWASGERGLTALPGRQDEFLTSVELALNYAKILNCSRLHVMSGLQSTAHSLEDQLACYIENLKIVAAMAKAQAITVLIEPINTKDIPGYFLCDFEMAQNVIEDVGADNLRLQFDIYHCQRIMGDVIHNLHRYLPLTSHIQIANPPARNEPSKGELNFDYIFDFLSQNYEGWVGCEYKPSTDGPASLSWAAPYLEKNQG